MSIANARNAAAIVHSSLCTSVNSKGRRDICRTKVQLFLVLDSTSQIAECKHSHIFSPADFEEAFDDEELDASYASTGFDDNGKLCRCNECVVLR